jgi:hypothetical protein
LKYIQKDVFRVGDCAAMSIHHGDAATSFANFTIEIEHYVFPEVGVPT